MFFWVFPRRQIVVGRRFGTLYQFHLQRLDVDCLKSRIPLRDFMMVPFLIIFRMRNVLDKSRRENQNIHFC